MTPNINFQFTDVAVLSVEACEAPVVVTSAELDARLAPFYERARCVPGAVQMLAGSHLRRQWPADISFTDAAAMAGQRAIAAAGIDAADVGVIIDASVSRARLEPSSAVTVHHLLGLPAGCLNFDVSNACLGFLTGMHLAAVLIETGQVDHAVVVDGEGTRELYDNTVHRLNTTGSSLRDLLTNFATFTLGSGAAGMVLGRRSDHPDGHELLHGFFRAASEHHDLCVGTLEGGTTDSQALLKAGIGLAAAAWEKAGTSDRWCGRDRYILHQVSDVHTDGMIAALELEPERVPRTFPTLGNIGPAAIPITLASVSAELSAGNSVLCMGIGSGLNVGLLEIRW